MGFYAGTSNYNTSQDGQSEAADRESQMKFQEVLRESSMSFFKTTKSTQLNSQDVRSNQHRTTNNFFQAWGDQLPYDALQSVATRNQNNADNNSDLGAQTENVMAGGSLSILRRKGKAFKVVGNTRADNLHKAPVEQINSELLSKDILTLVKEYKEEAKHYKPVSQNLFPNDMPQ